MPEWLHITLAAVSVAILSLLLIILLRRWCCLREPQKSPPVNDEASPARSNSFQARIAKLHQTSLIHQLDTSDIKRRGNINNYYVFRGGGGGGGSGYSPAKSGLFSWTDHPSLATDAVENGWSRFGFTVRSPPQQQPPPPPSYASGGGGGAARSALFGFCTIGAGGEDSGREYPGVEIGWEVTNGSSDFMQTIRFNRALRDIVNHTITPFAILRASLPLPGPQLGNSAFPQEAYFEITVIGILLRRDGDGGGCGGGGGDDEVALTEGEKTKLFNNEEPKLVRCRDCDGDREDAVVCVGLTAGGSGGDMNPPGSFTASIGFQSNGSIYLDGIKLVFESEKHEWGKANKVIGCGYDPRKKKVYFTVDSHLVHVINCKAEEFGAPLYPTIASNTEVTIHINFGQCPFSYGPANSQRTPNPCFIGPVVRSSAATAAGAGGFEDSRELFSMGRIDSQYLNSFVANRGNSEGNTSGRTTISDSNRRKMDDDDDSDADLFEIVLENPGRPTGPKL